MNPHGGVDDLTTYVIDLHTANNERLASRERHRERSGPFSAALRSSLRLCVKPIPSSDSSH